VNLGSAPFLLSAVVHDIGPKVCLATVPFFSFLFFVYFYFFFTFDIALIYPNVLNPEVAKDIRCTKRCAIAVRNRFGSLLFVSVVHCYYNNLNCRRNM